ncbi:MAG: hypothetical protein ACK5N8_08610 [Alphaproteobacteria bacterium]
MTARRVGWRKKKFSEKSFSTTGVGFLMSEQATAKRESLESKRHERS